MELRAVRYALAVADLLHFGAAAKQVLVSQPSLSRQVRTLEREIGAELFARTSRRVELTAAGRQFMPTARRALALLDQAADQARQVERGRLGELRLGFVATAAIDVLPAAVALYRTHRPRVRVSLTECTSAEQTRMLLDGTLDVGIGRDLRGDDALSVKVLRTEPILVAVCADHPLAERPSLRIEDLAGQSVVRLPPGRAPRADNLLVLLSGMRSGDVGVQEANQYMTLLALVAAGLGFALVPQPVPRLRQEGMCYLPLDHPEASSALTLTHRADDDGPIVRDFCDLVLDNPLTQP